MIINVRGTSGSGKSTIVRRVMATYPRRNAVGVVGRKRPLGYICSGLSGPRLAVVGHYETDCGGCDTINSMDRIYELVRESHRQGMHVLYEGLLVTGEHRRAIALHDDGLPLTVYALDVPLEECLASINARRREKWERRVLGIELDNEAKLGRAQLAGRKSPKLQPIPPAPPPVAEKNTKSKWNATRTGMKHLQEAGVPAYWGSRDEVLDMVLRQLELRS